MKNDINVIETTAQITAKEVVSELRKQGLLKNNRQSPFQKTETLLYNYNNFKAAINDKYEQIETIKCEGLPQKSKSITSFSGSASFAVRSESDKVNEKIEAIEQSIQVTNNFIKVIDAAIDALKDDPYFDIIPMKYFECKSREDIAAFYDVDASTISRHKNRLVNLLQIRLFSDEVIYQIFS